MTTVYVDHRDADIDVDGDRLVVRFGCGPVSVVPARGDAALRLAQYDLARDEPGRLVIARPLVARKIENEASLLHDLVSRSRGDARLLVDARRQLIDAAARLRSGAAAPTLPALMGHEGDTDAVRPTP